VPHALELLAQAARGGASLVCFPELYPRVGVEEVCRAARRHTVHVVAGLAEGTPQRWYNTAVVIAPSGEIIGRQRKAFPTQGELDNGVVPEHDYRVIPTEIGRLGIIICADLPFFGAGLDALVAQQADILINPSWWFALGAGYPATVIGRHMECGKPIVGIDIAACALKRRVDGRLIDLFPRAGGYSTVCVPPPVATLPELADWFRNKPGGTNTLDGFAATLGEDEGILYAEIDLDAARRFRGYFYRAAAAEARL
jgi:predicted amidohydrolase